MKSGPAYDCWPPVVSPLAVKRSELRFCLYPKVKSVDDNPKNVPIYLNVYDLTPANGYLYWAGLGVFHTGVEVHGIEYAFGAHDCPTSGVFEAEPRECPGFKFRKSILMGTTNLDPLKIRDFMEYHSEYYHGDTYHLIAKNCNHFCADICHRLTGNSIPKWVNRLARIGSVCKCILLVALKAANVQQDPKYRGHHPSEKRSLQSSRRLSLTSRSHCQRVQKREPKSPLIRPSQPRRPRKGSGMERFSSF